MAENADNELKAFAQKVKEARAEKKLTQARVAKEINISVAQYSNIECARNWPSAPLMASICRLLRISFP